MKKWEFTQSETLDSSFNPLKTIPEYTLAEVCGKCVLKQNQIVFKLF